MQIVKRTVSSALLSKGNYSHRTSMLLFCPLNISNNEGHLVCKGWNLSASPEHIFNA